MKNIKERHPSYVKVGFSRTESNRGETFYGSDIKANSYITLRIHTAERLVDGYSEHHCIDKLLVELRLSPTQFAELLTTLNVGEGVPGTLTYINPVDLPIGQRIEPPPANQKLDLIQNHIAAFGDSVLNNRIVAMEEAIEAVKMPQSAKLRLKNLLGGIKAELTSNLPYYVEIAQRQINKTLSDAKGIIDSFYTGMCVRLGIKALGEQQNRLQEINFDKEDK